MRAVVGRLFVLLGGADGDGAVGLRHAAAVALAAVGAGRRRRVVEVAGRLLVEPVVGAGPVAGRGPEIKATVMTLIWSIV